MAIEIAYHQPTLSESDIPMPIGHLTVSSLEKPNIVRARFCTAVALDDRISLFNHPKKVSSVLAYRPFRMVPASPKQCPLTVHKQSVAWASHRAQQFPVSSTLIHSGGHHASIGRCPGARPANCKVPSHFASGKELELNLVIFLPAWMVGIATWKARDLKSKVSANFRAALKRRGRQKKATSTSTMDKLPNIAGIRVRDAVTCFRHNLGPIADMPRRTGRGPFVLVYNLSIFRQILCW